ncbi:MAG TPA: hypothetical protein PKY59_14815 [Pyrinomonadaceae bacterium]|nr:hypothetical protein [Pyrinomonadaceae bacterium]
MIHFIYLLVFAMFVSLVFGAIASGTTKERVIYGLKTFLQFVVISLVMAWIFYFIPYK